MIPDDNDSSEASGVVTPRRTNLSKVAIQRSAASRLAADVPFRHSRDASEDRQTYDSTTLAELRQSTPSTPKPDSDLLPDTANEPVTSGENAIDLASKFGSSLARYSTPSAIPSATEIAEKKARRARLAREQDFISLSANDSDIHDDDDLDDNVIRDEHGKLILKPTEKYAETRLVRDDEDIFENFDSFTSDGRIALGRDAEKADAQRRRTEMAGLIADAEAQSDGVEDGEDPADDSELERHAAFEDAQTRSGTYATRHADEADAARPVTPPRIAPLPTLDSVMTRLKARLEDMQVARAVKAQELEKLRAERTQIEKDEVRVQSALKETAEKYESMRRDLAERQGRSAEDEMQVVQSNGNSLGALTRPAGLGLGAAPRDSDDEAGAASPMSTDGESDDDDY